MLKYDPPNSSLKFLFGCARMYQLWTWKLCCWGWCFHYAYKHHLGIHGVAPAYCYGGCGLGHRTYSLGYGHGVGHGEYKGLSGSKCYQFVWTFAFKTAKGLLSFSSYYHIYFLKLIAGTIGYSINDYNVDLFFLDRIVPMVTLTYGKI